MAVAVSEKFLKAEQMATELVASLERLKHEVESYSAATSELGAVRTQLADFIASNDELAKQAYAAVVTARDIGGPQILDQLGAVSEQVRKGRSELAQISDQTEALKRSAGEVSAQNEALRGKADELSANLKKTHSVAVFASVMAAIAAILAVVGLLK